jgi:hypothetical protein
MKFPCGPALPRSGQALRAARHPRIPEDPDHFVTPVQRGAELRRHAREQEQARRAKASRAEEAARKTRLRAEAAAAQATQPWLLDEE